MTSKKRNRKKRRRGKKFKKTRDTQRRSSGDGLPPLPPNESQEGKVSETLESFFVAAPTAPIEDEVSNVPSIHIAGGLDSALFGGHPGSLATEDGESARGSDPAKVGLALQEDIHTANSSVLATPPPRANVPRPSPTLPLNVMPVERFAGMVAVLGSTRWSMLDHSDSEAQPTGQRACAELVRRASALWSSEGKEESKIPHRRNASSDPVVESKTGLHQSLPHLQPSWHDVAIGLEAVGQWVRNTQQVCRLSPVFAGCEDTCTGGDSVAEALEAIRKGTGTVSVTHRLLACLVCAAVHDVVSASIDDLRSRLSRQVCVFVRDLVTILPRGALSRGGLLSSELLRKLLGMCGRSSVVFVVQARATLLAVCGQPHRKWGCACATDEDVGHLLRVLRGVLDWFAVPSAEQVARHVATSRMSRAGNVPALRLWDEQLQKLVSKRKEHRLPVVHAGCLTAALQCAHSIVVSLCVRPGNSSRLQREPVHCLTRVHRTPSSAGSSSTEGKLSPRERTSEEKDSVPRVLCLRSHVRRLLAVLQDLVALVLPQTCNHQHQTVRHSSRELVCALFVVMNGYVNQIQQCVDPTTESGSPEGFSSQSRSLARHLRSKSAVPSDLNSRTIESDSPSADDGLGESVERSQDSVHDDTDTALLTALGHDLPQVLYYLMSALPGRVWGTLLLGIDSGLRKILGSSGLSDSQSHQPSKEPGASPAPGSRGVLALSRKTFTEQLADFLRNRMPEFVLAVLSKAHPQQWLRLQSATEVAAHCTLVPAHPLAIYGQTELAFVEDLDTVSSKNGRWAQSTADFTSSQRLLLQNHEAMYEMHFSVHLPAYLKAASKHQRFIPGCRLVFPLLPSPSKLPELARKVALRSRSEAKGSDRGDLEGEALSEPWYFVNLGSCWHSSAELGFTHLWRSGWKDRFRRSRARKTPGSSQWVPAWHGRTPTVAASMLAANSYSPEAGEAPIDRGSFRTWMRQQKRRYAQKLRSGINSSGEGDVAVVLPHADATSTAAALPKEGQPAESAELDVPEGGPQAAGPRGGQQSSGYTSLSEVTPAETSSTAAVEVTPPAALDAYANHPGVIPDELLQDPLPPARLPAGEGPSLSAGVGASENASYKQPPPSSDAPQHSRTPRDSLTIIAGASSVKTPVTLKTHVKTPVTLKPRTPSDKRGPSPSLKPAARGSRYSSDQRGRSPGQPAKTADGDSVSRAKPVSASPPAIAERRKSRYTPEVKGSPAVDLLPSEPSVPTGVECVHPASQADPGEANSIAELRNQLYAAQRRNEQLLGENRALKEQLADANTIQRRTDKQLAQLRLQQDSFIRQAEQRQRQRFEEDVTHRIAEATAGMRTELKQLSRKLVSLRLEKRSLLNQHRRSRRQCDLLRMYVGAFVLAYRRDLDRLVQKNGADLLRCTRHSKDKRTEPCGPSCWLTQQGDACGAEWWIPEGAGLVSSEQDMARLLHRWSHHAPRHQHSSAAAASGSSIAPTQEFRPLSDPKCAFWFMAPVPTDEWAQVLKAKQQDESLVVLPTLSNPEQKAETKGEGDAFAPMISLWRAELPANPSEQNDGLSSPVHHASTAVRQHTPAGRSSLYGSPGPKARDASGLRWHSDQQLISSLPSALQALAFVWNSRQAVVRNLWNVRKAAENARQAAFIYSKICKHHLENERPMLLQELTSWKGKYRRLTQLLSDTMQLLRASHMDGAALKSEISRLRAGLRWEKQHRLSLVPELERQRKKEAWVKKNALPVNSGEVDAQKLARQVRVMGSHRVSTQVRKSLQTETQPAPQIPADLRTPKAGDRRRRGSHKNTFTRRSDGGEVGSPTMPRPAGGSARSNSKTKRRSNRRVRKQKATGSSNASGSEVETGDTVMVQSFRCSSCGDRMVQCESIRDDSVTARLPLLLSDKRVRDILRQGDELEAQYPTEDGREGKTENPEGPLQSTVGSPLVYPYPCDSSSSALQKAENPARLLQRLVSELRVERNRRGQVQDDLVNCQKRLKSASDVNRFLFQTFALQFPAFIASFVASEPQAPLSQETSQQIKKCAIGWMQRMASLAQAYQVDGKGAGNTAESQHELAVSMLCASTKGVMSTAERVATLWTSRLHPVLRKLLAARATRSPPATPASLRTAASPDQVMSSPADPNPAISPHEQTPLAQRTPSAASKTVPHRVHAQQTPVVSVRPTAPERKLGLSSSQRAALQKVNEALEAPWPGGFDPSVTDITTARADVERYSAYARQLGSLLHSSVIDGRSEHHNGLEPGAGPLPPSAEVAGAEAQLRKLLQRVVSMKASLHSMEVGIAKQSMAAMPEKKLNLSDEQLMAAVQKLSQDPRWTDCIWRSDLDNAVAPILANISAAQRKVVRYSANERQLASLVHRTEVEEVSEHRADPEMCSAPFRPSAELSGAKDHLQKLQQRVVSMRASVSSMEAQLRSLVTGMMNKHHSLRTAIESLHSVPATPSGYTPHPTGQIHPLSEITMPRNIPLGAAAATPGSSTEPRRPATDVVGKAGRVTPSSVKKTKRDGKRVSAKKPHGSMKALSSARKGSVKKVARRRPPGSARHRRPGHTQGSSGVQPPLSARKATGSSMAGRDGRATRDQIYRKLVPYSPPPGRGVGVRQHYTPQHQAKTPLSTAPARPASSAKPSSAKPSSSTSGHVSRIPVPLPAPMARNRPISSAAEMPPVTVSPVNVTSVAGGTPSVDGTLTGGYVSSGSVAHETPVGESSTNVENNAHGPRRVPGALQEPGSSPITAVDVVASGPSTRTKEPSIDSLIAKYLKK